MYLFKTFLSWLLSLLLCFGFSFSGLTENDLTDFLREKEILSDYDEEDAEEETVSYESTAPSVSLRDYEHYDPTNFYADCDRLSALASEDDWKAVRDLYDSLYAEFSHMYTLGTVAYILYSENTLDETLAEESEYCENMMSDAADALCLACRAVLQGKNGEDFADYLGEDSAEYLLDYEALTERESELIARETALIQDYYDIMASMDDYTYRYGGRDWCWSELWEESGDRLAAYDYDGFYEVYDGILAAVNADVGAVYMELVRLRTELAESYGYDTYTDYAYECIYGRDYTPEQAQALCEEVKQSVGPAYYSEVYYNDYRYAESGAAELYSAEELLSMLEICANQTCDMASDAWTMLTENELYSIGNEDGRMETCYQTSLSEGDIPFLFLYQYGGERDLMDISHEFGHFVAATQESSSNLLSDVPNRDIAEIHSYGFQLLCMRYYDEIFPEADTNVLRYENLTNIVGVVVDGCLYDEFQRRVYENPDMSLEEVNSLFCELSGEYGEYERGPEDYYWMLVSHNFDDPLYYISYSVSALAALQIWEQSETDYEAAVDTWEAVIDYGRFNQYYLEALEEVGLRSFTEPGTAEDVCSAAFQYLRDLSA